MDGTSGEQVSIAAVYRHTPPGNQFRAQIPHAAFFRAFCALSQLSSKPRQLEAVKQRHLSAHDLCVADELLYVMAMATFT